MLVVAVWDDNYFHVVDRGSMDVSFTIRHPKGESRCWGLRAMPGLNLEE